VSTRSTVTLLRDMQWPAIICRSTDLPARTGRTGRLADLTRAAGGSAYLCGTGGSRYLDPSPFTAHGLTVEMFTPPQHQLRAGRSRVTALTDLAVTGPEMLARQRRSRLRVSGRPRAE
jgi:hypothetical protein